MNLALALSSPGTTVLLLKEFRILPRQQAESIIYVNAEYSLFLNTNRGKMRKIFETSGNKINNVTIISFTTYM